MYLNRDINKVRTLRWSDITPKSLLIYSFPDIFSLAIYLLEKAGLGHSSWKVYHTVGSADCTRVVQFHGSSVAWISCKLVVKSRGLIYSGSAFMTASQVVLCISIRRHTAPVCLSL